jgi:hypothetical protein
MPRRKILRTPQRYLEPRTSIQLPKAFLERLHAGTIHPGTGGGSMIAGPQLLEFCSRAEFQLNALSTLQANALRHIGPLVK